MKNNKNSRLFKHFMSILNILACSVPLIAFAIVTLQDVLPKYFTSLGMQHHGDGSSTFDDDLNALTDSNQFKDMNYHMLNTLDRLDYFNYDITGYRQVQYQTNEVSSIDDLVVGNVYQFNFQSHLFNRNESQLICSLSDFFIIQINSFSLDLSQYDYQNLYFHFRFETPSSMFSIVQIVNSIDLSTYDELFLFIDNIYTEPNTYNPYIIYFVYTGTLTSFDFINYISSADLSLITPKFEEVEGYDNFDDFIDYQNNRSYTDIIQDTDTHLPLNIDFISLFTQSEIINRNGNVAIYLFINYYMNYLINILMILLLPEFILIFIDIVRQLLYKYTNIKECD